MVDDEKGAENDSGVEESSAANQNRHSQENQHSDEQTREVRQRIVDDSSVDNGEERTKGTRSIGLLEISGLVTVLAASIYVLGIFAYWIPISRIYTKDINTALYATSQIPRTIIAGQGVTGFIGPWLMVTVVLLGYAWVAWTFVATFEGGPEWMASINRVMRKVYGPSIGLTIIAFLAPTYVPFLPGPTFQLWKRP